MSRSGVNIKAVLGRPPVHPFPARMAPGLALPAFRRLEPGSVVLDPMVGSGTVVALARASGFRALGFDIDPLAVLTARVWTRTIAPDLVRERARQVLSRARGLFRETPVRDAYPVSCDRETRTFVRYWFDPYTRRQLSALAKSIRRVRRVAIRDVLWCAFSRTVIAKKFGASLAMDLAHSRPHRVFKTAPRKPFRSFLIAVERVLDGCVAEGSVQRGPVATIREGDARSLPLAGGSVDLVFTSPPYLNAIDYVRCSKFSLVWMGHSVGRLRDLRRVSIGTEAPGGRDADVAGLVEAVGKGLDRRTKGVVSRYIDDMRQAVAEAARVVHRKGRVVFVVGENTIRGSFVPTGKIVRALAAREGLRLTSQRTRELPQSRRYLPPPGDGDTRLDQRMTREVILHFAVA